MRISKAIRVSLLSILALTLASIPAGFLAAGFSLCRGGNHAVTRPGNVDLERIEIPAAGGGKTAAWYGDAPSEKAFILVHGNSSDRNAMVARARYFHSLGYAVILPDLSGHGETQGRWKSFGYREGGDVANAFHYLRQKRGKTWIAGLGTSLGGASLLKAQADGVPFDALVLEAVFADIRTAARNRLQMRFGEAGALLEPLLTIQLGFWTGVSRDRIRPEVWAKSDTCPTLMLSGREDLRARPAEAAAIYRSIPGSDKSLFLIDGAGHVDLFAFDKSVYKERIDAFLGSLQN